MRIDAPFSPDQVQRLNEWRAAPGVHPFTCANRGDGDHRRTTDLGVLVATVDGWICPDCSCTQRWAHQSMTEPRHR